MKGEVSSEITSKGRTIKNQIISELFYDGDRSNLRGYLWGEINFSGRLLSREKADYVRTMYNGKEVKHYTEAVNSKYPPYYTIDPTISKERAQLFVKKAISRGWEGHEAFGYFGDDERVDVHLQEADTIQLKDTKEKVNGVDCYFIEAISKNVKYKLWIDPEHNYNITKAIVLKMPNSFMGSKRLVDGEVIRIELNVTSYKKVDGVWVVSEADIVRQARTNEYEFLDKTHYKILNVQFNPDFDKLEAFSESDVKNGTKVWLVGVKGINYTWQDGELIPDIDEAVIDEIDKMAETIRTKSTIAPMGATVSELLKKYAETQDKLRSFIAKGESTIEYIKIPRQSGRMQKELCEFRTDGDRVNHRGSVRDKVLSKYKALYKFFLWDGESFIHYRQGSQLTDSTVFIEKNDESKKRMIATEYKGAPLMGICGGDYDRIDSILRKADNISLRQKTEQVGNSQCYVIDAVTKRGEYRVWICPEHGYNIAKIEQKKRKADLIGSSERVKIGMLFLLKNVRFEKIDEVWVPVEADMKQYQDDRISIIQWHHKRTKMTLNPDHNALGSFVPDDIPEGTKVTIPGNRKIRSF